MEADLRAIIGHSYVQHTRSNDVLIGADQLRNLYTGERRDFGKDYPCSINLPFCWVITSFYNSYDDEHIAATHHVALDSPAV